MMKRGILSTRLAGDLSGFVHTTVGSSTHGLNTPMAHFLWCLWPVALRLERGLRGRVDVL